MLPVSERKLLATTTAATSTGRATSVVGEGALENEHDDDRQDVFPLKVARKVIVWLAYTEG